MMLPADLRARAERIKLLILDVDGVLTDGRIYVDSERENLKAFHVQDGLGMKLLQQAGIELAIITGKESAMVSVRMATLGVKHVAQNQPNKIAAFERLLTKLNLDPSAVAYVGDDLPDLALLTRVGLAVAVANAQPCAKKIAHYQTQAKGGKGAVREVCDLLLQAQGKWDLIENSFVKTGGWH